MKRTNFKILLIMLSVIFFNCGIQQSSPPDPPEPKNFDIDLKYTCTKYQGSVKIIILSYDKDPGLFRSRFKEDEYVLSPKNNEEKDNYDYSTSSYALLVIGKGGNPILVTVRDSIEMENGQYITVEIVRHNLVSKTVPIKSVLIQD